MSTLRVNNITNSSGSGSTYAAGHVVQVVSVTVTSQVTNNTTGWVDSGVAASITPKSASSKIFISANIQVDCFRNLDANGYGLRILRDSTVVLEDTNKYSSYSAMTSSGATSMEFSLRNTFQYMDSPATTSSITYKIQGSPYSTANSGFINFQQAGHPSTITLMEVAV